MISQDIRTLYCDSNWCNVDPDGSFRLDMFETIEVKEGMVAYVDDITVQGSMPHVSTANNRIYVIEKTPYLWKFEGNVSTTAGDLTVVKTQMQTVTSTNVIWLDTVSYILIQTTQDYIGTV